MMFIIAYSTYTRAVMLFLLAISSFALPLAVAAQKKADYEAINYMSYAGGVEYNRFSPHNTGAAGVYLEYSPIENRLARFSLRATLSNDLIDTTSGDLGFTFALSPLYFSKVQLYVGADQGVFYSLAADIGKFSLALNFLLGIRIIITEHFFIEPYGRIGLPVMFAGGMLAGMRCNYEKK
jgi:hypothetical protein